MIKIFSKHSIVYWIAFIICVPLFTHLFYQDISSYMQFVNEGKADFSYAAIIQKTFLCLLGALGLPVFAEQRFSNDFGVSKQ